MGTALEFAKQLLTECGEGQCEKALCQLARMVVDEADPTPVQSFPLWAGRPATEFRVQVFGRRREGKLFIRRVRVERHTENSIIPSGYVWSDTEPEMSIVVPKDGELWFDFTRRTQGVIRRGPPWTHEPFGPCTVHMWDPSVEPVVNIRCATPTGIPSSLLVCVEDWSEEDDEDHKTPFIGGEQNERHNRHAVQTRAALVERLRDKAFLFSDDPILEEAALAIEVLEASLGPVQHEWAELVGALTEATPDAHPDDTPLERLHKLVLNADVEYELRTGTSSKNRSKTKKEDEHG